MALALAEVKDLNNFALSHANRFYGFLFKESKEDTEQEVRLCVLQHGRNPGTLADFNRLLNNTMYALAKSMGYRKTSPKSSRFDRELGLIAKWVKIDCKSLSNPNVLRIVNKGNT